jgi:hypothetical protein
LVTDYPDSSQFNKVERGGDGETPLEGLYQRMNKIYEWEDGGTFIKIIKGRMMGTPQIMGKCRIGILPVFRREI